jgi:ferric-dicitrate binding protein FerR (iron transport regulator)
MDCEQATHLISARMDNEIPPADAALLASHLNECAACRSAVEAFQAQDVDLRRAYTACESSAGTVAARVVEQVRTTLVPKGEPMSHKPMITRRRLPWLFAAAAVVAGIAFGLKFWPKQGGPQPGPIVQNNDQPRYDELDYMTPRPRGQAPAAVPLVFSSSVETKAGERRRVTLPDGSVLSMNENTKVTLSADRQLRVEIGEVYLEVAPRTLTGKARAETFVVQTPKRQVTALGTKFMVQVAPEGTGVVVTQGKVKVNDVDGTVAAGQQLRPGEKSLRAAPRASHVLDWTRDLVAAAESPLVPKSGHCGGSLIAIDPYGQEARLTLREYHVDVHIEDGFARTTIDQTYFNHNAFRQEGTFYFPLPADASLSRLAMYVADGKECNLMEGGMAERDYARDVFEQIITTQRDPALLEWLDGSTFKMRVFPLEGRQEKRIVLSYTQKLDSLYAQNRYRFPGGHNLPAVGEWSFHARVKNGAHSPWAASDTMLKATEESGDLVLNAAAKNVKPDRDITLSLNDEAGKNATARFNSMVQDNAHYLMLRYRPNLEGTPVRQHRDWVFLYETSGDRDPLLARAQIEVIRTLLDNAEHDDTFNILQAGVGVKWFADKAKPATAENVKEAVKWLESAHLIGALDLNKALTEAKKHLSGTSPCLVQVGTGIAALGERNENKLLEALPKEVPFVGVGVGKRWSRSFMKNAAERSGGAFTQINPDESIGWRAFELSALLNTPRLMNVAVVDDAEKAKFLTFTSAVAQGEEVCAITRVTDPAELPKSITISGTFAGKQRVETVPVASVAANAGYLPRTWAKLEIDRLLAQDGEANKKAIVDLSKQMYVMTPYTSLLVLENEAMYTQFKVDRGRKDHWALYACPPKVPLVYQPDPSQGVDWRFRPQVAATPSQKPSAEAVLQSILVRLPARFFSPRNPQNANQLVFTAYQLRGGAFSLAEVDADEAMVYRREGKGMADPMERSKFTSPPTNSGPGRRDGLFTGVPRPTSATSAVPMEFAARRGGLRDDRLAGQDMLRKATAESNAMPALRQLQGQTANRFDAGFDRQLENMQSFGDLKGLGREKIPALAGKRARGDKGEQAESSDAILARLLDGYILDTLIYSRPGFGGDERYFHDLLSHAPGMNTTRTDILTTLDLEAAPEPSQAPGNVDERAAKLIEQARSSGWRSVTIAASGRQAAYTVTFDGQGRYAYERVLPEGLREQVVCDGTTLLHLYPDLCVGARRTGSRFHRADFTDLVPWALPTIEDLARGMNLTMNDERTVRLSPRETETGKPAFCVDIVFAADGRLAERRVVEMPANKVRSRETYSADGVVQTFDGDGKVVAEQKLPTAAAQPANLTPDLKKLVVLTLPYRTQQHVFQAAGMTNWDFRNVKEETALALLSSFWLQQPWMMLQVYQQHFQSQGDRHLGFAVIFAASSQGWIDGSNGWPNLLGDRSQPLAKYLAVVGNPNRRSDAVIGDVGGDKAGFIQRLAAFRDLLVFWTSDKPLTDEQKKSERDKAIAYVRSNQSSVYGWAVLSAVRERLTNDREASKDLAEVFQLFDKRSGLAYAARYEYARITLANGNGVKARELFLDLYAKMLKEGTLPPVDATFRRALTAKGWEELARQTAAKFLAQKQRLAVVALAGQCRQLDDAALADSLVEQALKDVPAAERLSVTLAVVEHHWQAGQHKKAEALLDEMLADKELSQNAQLWHLAARLANRERMTARGVALLDKALEVEFKQLPAVINLQQVRYEYGQLLNAYQQLVNATAMLEREAPKELVGKVVRAADRWRALDPDGTLACQSAARILKLLGQNELAWEYLTTPAALRPNEAAPFLQLAQALRYDGDGDLADRAYAMAFEREPTNAQILLERAQALQQVGKLVEARKVYRQIADGEWQPRFRWMQQQARWQLGMR